MAWTKRGFVLLVSLTVVASQIDPNKMQRFRQFVQLWQRFQQFSRQKAQTTTTPSPPSWNPPYPRANVRTPLKSPALPSPSSSYYPLRNVAPYRPASQYPVRNYSPPRANPYPARGYPSPPRQTQSRPGWGQRTPTAWRPPALARTASTGTMDPSNPVLGPCTSNKQCPDSHCCVPATASAPVPGTSLPASFPKICLDRKLAAGRCTLMPAGSCKNSYDCPAGQCCMLNVTSAPPSMATGGKPFTVYGSCSGFGKLNAQCMVQPPTTLPEGLHVLCPCSETYECIPDGRTAGRFGKTGRCLTPEMRRCRSARECGRGHCCRPLSHSSMGGGFGVCEPLGRHGAACSLNNGPYGMPQKRCPCEADFMCMPGNTMNRWSREGVCKPIVPRSCTSDAQCSYTECCAKYSPRGGSTSMWRVMAPPSTCQPRGMEGQECQVQSGTTTGLPAVCGCAAEMFCVPQGGSRRGGGVIGHCSLTEPVSCASEADCGANECCLSGACQAKGGRGKKCSAMNPLMAAVFGSAGCGCKAGLVCRPTGPRGSSGICS